MSLLRTSAKMIDKNLPKIKFSYSRMIFTKIIKNIKSIVAYSFFEYVIGLHAFDLDAGRIMYADTNVVQKPI